MLGLGCRYAERAHFATGIVVVAGVLDGVPAKTGRALLPQI
jgi:hypothetical protein